MTILTRRRSRRPAPTNNSSAPTAAPRPPTQDELRSRRRAGLSATYTGGFDLGAEVAAILVPLATRITALTATHDPERGFPIMFQHLLRDLVDAVHGELVGGVVAWVAELDAKQRTEHLTHLDSASKAQAVRHLMDLAPRPPAPQIEPADIASGRWATVLVELVAPYTAPLADLLDRAWPPNHPALKGAPSRSERLCDLLREVDSAARQLELRIEKSERSRPARLRAQKNNRADVARAELAKLGIEVPQP